VRPWAIKIFEREWLVNLILWGCYKKLRDAALRVLGPDLPGRTIQLACVYGSLTRLLYKVVEESNGSLDVVDVIKPQLENAQRKLPVGNNVRMHQMDTSDLALPDASYDRVLLFFLMHEQPRAVRIRTLKEACRIVKPGGTILVLDFAKPKWWHPLRYLWMPILGILEPFAPDIWDYEDVSAWLPHYLVQRIIYREKHFGSFYQLLLLRK